MSAPLMAAPGSVTVTVVDGDGAAVSGFRWLLQEDVTFHPVPGDVLATDIQGVSFHPSHVPVISTGDSSGGGSAVVETPDDTKRYFVSILHEEHSVGGAAVGPGDTAVEVCVPKLPIPTAQLSIMVFMDMPFTNGAFDAEAKEPGLVGWRINLEEAGGKYGASSGIQMTDAFGNALGTTYDQDGEVLQQDRALETSTPTAATQAPFGRGPTLSLARWRP